MRLTKIKLAGFKSFVDPTSCRFPSNLVGVVGPNGCGKSNIIDAVRWVMGEISAKHLRGDSMADVIFNGSGSRKPVGTASVELVFDNARRQARRRIRRATPRSSLKRVVARDGTSAYFLNGARCRRKDITQLFLGTGLGSRSYAIIEQGMISRVIEAKAEDMRALPRGGGRHLAVQGAPHARPRARIAHTRENLERLQRRARGGRQAAPPPAAPGGHRAPLPGAQAGGAPAAGRAAGAAPARDRDRSRCAGRRSCASASSPCRPRSPSQRSLEAAIERSRAEHTEQSEQLLDRAGPLLRDRRRDLAHRAGDRARARAARRGSARSSTQLGRRARGGDAAACARCGPGRRACGCAGRARAGPRHRRAPQSEASADGAQRRRRRRCSDWQERWEAFNQSLRAGATTARSSARASRSSKISCAALVASASVPARELDTLAGGGCRRRRSPRLEHAGSDGARLGRRRRVAASRNWWHSCRPSGSASASSSDAAQAARRETLRTRGTHRVARSAAARRARAESGQGRRMAGGERARGPAAPRPAALGGSGLGARGGDRARRLSRGGVRRFDRRRRGHRSAAWAPAR